MLADASEEFDSTTFSPVLLRVCLRLWPWPSTLGVHVEFAVFLLKLSLLLAVIS